MQWISYMAKALTAVGVAFLGAVVQYNIDLNPLVMVAVTSVLAGLAVFIVPNGDRPSN